MRKNYASAMEWYKATKAAGFSVPVQMGHGLSSTMTILNLSFPQVWDILERRKVFCLVGKTYFFNLAWLNLPDAELKNQLKINCQELVTTLTNPRRKYG